MAFHSYPQLIRYVFNRNQFGPPWRVTATSPWSRIAHLASGLPHATQSPYSDSLSLRLRLNGLTLLRTVTRRLIKQKARRHPVPKDIGLRLLVGTRFQVLFHSPLGVLFTFPSRYWFTIGHQRVFSLGEWSPQIPTGFFVPRGTWDPNPGSPAPLPYRTVTFCGAPFQTLQLGTRFLTPRPDCSRNRFGPTTPMSQRLQAYMTSVWAVPFSLAATGGIAVAFSSYGY